MTTEPSLTFGERLKDHRRAGGMTIVKAASLVGISPKHLEDLEADAVKTPEPHVLFDLCKLYVIDYIEMMKACGNLVPASKLQPPSPANPGR